MRLSTFCGLRRDQEHLLPAGSSRMSRDAIRRPTPPISPDNGMFSPSASLRMRAIFLQVPEIIHLDPEDLLRLLQSHNYLLFHFISRFSSIETLTLSLVLSRYRYD